MAMRQLSCKNTPQYLRRCCSPIGQNNTKDFSAQSGGSIGRAVWKWFSKSRFPGALSALLVNLRRFISLPDLFPLAPANRPWVSEDEQHHDRQVLSDRAEITIEPSYSCKVHFVRYHEAFHALHICVTSRVHV